MITLPLNCNLLCASGSAYDIDPSTGTYVPDPIYSKAVAYSSPPTPIAADTINACLVGQTEIGIIVAFRGTLAPKEKDGWYDWLQDLFAAPVPYKNLPGQVHEGFLDAVNAILPQMISAATALNPGPAKPRLCYRPQQGRRDGAHRRISDETNGRHSDQAGSDFRRA
jgi:hypothetical protein